MSKVGRCRAIGVKEEEGEEQGKEEHEHEERIGWRHKGVQYRT
jgi:hypothetical protein